ncbi:hypothetical protein FNV43_RR21408 [Rhamnella rubrinervis]|uniref:Uncharacterized protein n=1 Tax=Rhamnella rubrinervis TaxID=2594499 RepID=A0A8K0E2M5_9ROSA|nr:hypothetical protein FNV43_RR21408 [Rhamnella rubrinervis]
MDLNVDFWTSVESSMVARGDLWRVEASHNSSTSGNDNSSLFLVQLGPVLFVHDASLLLPVHLSKQHLLFLCPTFGRSDPGLQAEVIHSVKEQLSLICSCTFVRHPSAFASIAVQGE